MSKQKTKIDVNPVVGHSFVRDADSSSIVYTFPRQLRYLCFSSARLHYDCFLLDHSAPLYGILTAGYDTLLIAASPGYCVENHSCITVAFSQTPKCTRLYRSNIMSVYTALYELSWPQWLSN